MKKGLHLTTSIDQPEVMENIIEKLATRRYDGGYGKVPVPITLQALDSSSVEIHISGNIEFDYNETQRIRIPYITCFLFSCKKEKSSDYELCWSSSLS